MNYLGRLLRSEKRYTHGTHRTCEPEETWARIRPSFSHCGITRIADVTRLDYIGVPVWLSVRPNSRCLAASQGKGLTAMQAKVSAAMESIESWHAEHVELPVVTGSYRQLRGRGAVDPRELTLRLHSPWHEEMGIAWIEGWDLIEERPRLVPYDLVHTDFVVGPLREPLLFVKSSNGLASGNDLVEAISHGLCEVIERDSSALWTCRAAHAAVSATFVDPHTVRDPACRGLLDRLEELEIDVQIWDETSDVGVPSIACKIFERKPRSFAMPVRLAGGFGCHPAKETALVRALTEAIQSRVTAISGGRDDLLRRFYAGVRVGGALHESPSPLDAAAVRDFESIESIATGTLHEDVDEIVRRLGAAGIRSAIVVDLSRQALGIPVVRVIVPGLEHLGHEGQFRRVGRRGADVLARTRPAA